MPQNQNIRIPFKTLQYVQSNGWLEEYAIFLAMKHSFVSSHLHTPTFRGLQRLHVAGHHKAYKALKFFKNKQWAIPQQDGSLRFKQSKQIYPGRTLIKISVGALHYKAIKKELQKALIASEYRQFEYALRAKHYSESPANARQLKGAKRALKNVKHVRNEWDDRGVNISYEGWSQRLSIPKTTAFNILQELKHDGWLQIEGNRIPTNIPNSLIHEALQGGLIYVKGANGFLQRQLPNSYHIPNISQPLC